LGSLRLDQVSLGLAGLAVGGTPAVVGFLGFATRLCHDLSPSVGYFGSWKILNPSIYHAAAAM
jgi:hypothetical protein